MQPLLILDVLKSRARVVTPTKHYVQSQHALLSSRQSPEKDLGKLTFAPRALGYNSYQILHSF